MQEFTHIDKNGQVRMVDVTAKEPSLRVAVARGTVTMNPDTFEKIAQQSIKKGNVLETARIAGVMAAKKTAEIIPMCHPLNITHVQSTFLMTKQTVVSQLKPRFALLIKPVLKWKP